MVRGGTIQVGAPKIMKSSLFYIYIYIYRERERERERERSLEKIQLDSTNEIQFCILCFKLFIFRESSIS